MKQRKIFQNFIFALLGTFLIGGCSSGSSGGGDDGGAASQSISGIVSDPAVEHADVILVKLDGTLAKISGKSGADGGFTLTKVPGGDLSGYVVKTSGGADTGTGQDFQGIALCLPLALYSQYDNVVVSPITCLLSAAYDGSDINAAIAKVKARLGDINVTADPATDPTRQALAMKLTLIAAEGKSFPEILAGLDITQGIDANDLSNIFNKASEAATKDSLVAFFAVIDAAASVGEALAPAYQKALIEAAIRETFKAELAALTDPVEIDNVNANIDKLVAHLIGLKGSASRSYLMKADVVATVTGGGGLSSRGKFVAAFTGTSFDPAIFNLVLLNNAATFSNVAKLAYYHVDNPVTGNLQLVVYDGATGKQTVVKNNVILDTSRGGQAFVLEGTQDGDKTTITGKKYGIFLDPNQSRETRIGQGRRGPFQYEFFFDNAFKRYEVGTPSIETLIFDSSMLSQALRDQGIQHLSGQYRLHNNITDPDNSYVDLTALQRNADALRGETGDSIFQTPIIARLVDGKMTQGRMVRILKNGTGATEHILITAIGIHKPADGAPARKLQTCPADLSTCSDVAGGDGTFSFLAESDTHLYLGKDGDVNVHALDKTTLALSAVTGITYPGPFDANVHLLFVGPSHGFSGVLTDFFSLSGANRFVSDGPNAYLVINYDIDLQDPLGFRKGTTKIRLYKHGQIVKLTGTTGVKMFDNGDGIDHGDNSDSETSVGHLNLAAVSDGKLFVESGNYDARNNAAAVPDPAFPGACQANSNGEKCSSVKYGYLNVGSTGKTAFDALLVEKSGLTMFSSRRTAPLAMNGKLFVSILEQEAVRGVSEALYRLHIYKLSDAVEVGTSVGRTAMTKTAERASGVFDGEVLAWDAVSNNLLNITRNELVLGDAQALSGDVKALSAVFGRTSGVPLSGIGTLYALRGHNGDHRWHLFAGEVDAATGLVHVDQIPTSAWLYD